jgi:hypothetical protein
MPAFSHFYPDVEPRKVWPEDLVEGESDAFSLPV